jgi:transposase-like protein
VVEELKNGLSVSEVQHKYGIRNSSTITRWAKSLGAGSLLNEVIHVKMRNETDELKRLKKEVQRLKIALADKTLAHDALESLLEVAGIDVAALKKTPCVRDPALFRTTRAPREPAMSSLRVKPQRLLQAPGHERENQRDER